MGQVDRIVKVKEQRGTAAGRQQLKKCRPDGQRLALNKDRIKVAHARQIKQPPQGALGKIGGFGHHLPRLIKATKEVARIDKTAHRRLDAILRQIRQILIDPIARARRFNRIGYNEKYFQVQLTHT